MNAGPILEQLGAPLRLLLVRDQPSTIDVTLTLPPEATALTDATIIIENADVPPPTVFLDTEGPHFQIAWTTEETEQAPLSACRYAIVVALDDAPLRVLFAGSLSWVDQWTPGASTSMAVTADVNFGALELTATIVFGGPQGPPGGGGGGGVTSVNGDPGPAVILPASAVPATPSEGLSGVTVQAQLDQADDLFEALAADLSALQDGVEAGLAGKVSSVVAGPHVTVDATDPQNPIVSSVTDTFVVNSMAAMLALPAHRGDLAIRTDVSATFVLATDGAAVLGHWHELFFPGVTPGELAAVAFSGAYADLSGEPVLGTAAAQDVTAFDAAGAAAAAQAFAIQRANHTGVQAIATVTGLQTALDAKLNVPNPLIGKIVVGTNFGGALTDVGYDDAASPVTLGFRTFTGQLKANTPEAADDLTTKAYVDTGLAAKASTTHAATHAVGGTDALTALQVAGLLELVTLDFAEAAPGPGVWLRRPA